jgi:hypothetical protein
MHGCAVPSLPALSGAPYLPCCSLADYLALVRAQHPLTARLLNFERARAREVLEALATAGNEFESDRGGRGTSYRRAQRNTDVRSRGILDLLGMVVGDRSLASLPDDFVVLDVLGGDGLVAKVLGRRHPSAARPCRVVRRRAAAARAGRGGDLPPRQPRGAAVRPGWRAPAAPRSRRWSPAGRCASWACGERRRGRRWWERCRC